MRIAIVASDYAPTVGGVQIAVRNIAHHSARMGHSVTILSALPRYDASSRSKINLDVSPYASRDDASDVPTREEVDGIVVHRFPWGRRPLWSLPFRAAQTLIGMARALRQFKPDLVYIHFLTINALFVLLLHYVSRFTLILSARGNDIQGIPLRSRLQRWMLTRLFRRADAVLFCSSYIQRDAEEYLRHVSPRAYVGVLGDGFNPEEFENRIPFTHPKPFILAMGRLVEKKGFDLLIRAFGEIASEFQDIELLIAGDGDQRAKLEQLLDDLNLRARVSLLGFADREKTLTLFLGCEFFVLSSRIEPFGIVVLEAMAARKAVLATKSGGVIDLIQPGINGILVEPTSDALAAGMRGFLAHPDKTRAMGERALSTIQKYTWSAVTQQYLDVFARVLGSNK